VTNVTRKAATRARVSGESLAGHPGFGVFKGVPDNPSGHPSLKGSAAKGQAGGVFY